VEFLLRIQSRAQGWAKIIECLFLGLWIVPGGALSVWLRCPVPDRLQSRKPVTIYASGASGIGCFIEIIWRQRMERLARLTSTHFREPQASVESVRKFNWCALAKVLCSRPILHTDRLLVAQYGSAVLARYSFRR